MSINSIIQNLAQVVSNTPRVSTVEADRQTTGPFPLAPGQPVQAEVLAGLPNNRFLARIAGELFKMELPIIVQPGEALEMTYVTGEPRPTFSLSISGNSGTPVQISDVGKWLNQLSQNNAPLEQTASLPRRGIILDGPPDDTNTLAGQLRETLSLSGLFYESHLMQCFLGERQVRDILREPQGKLAQRTKGNPEVNSPAERAATERDETAARLVEDTPFREAANGARSESGGYVHPSTLGLVKEQLETLASGIFAWHGQVWPEQQMEWTVCEREARSGEAACAEWETTIYLELPKLGGINSVIQLRNDGLHLRIRTDKTSSVESMQTEKEALAQKMAEAGVRLVEMVIEHEAP